MELDTEIGFCRVNIPEDTATRTVKLQVYEASIVSPKTLTIPLASVTVTCSPGKNNFGEKNDIVFDDES
jgi:hypothetical protein